MPLAKTIVLLLSGGPDCVTLLYQMVSEGHRVHCLLANYGQHHADAELTMARYHCHRLGVLFTTIELPQLHGSTLTDGKGTVVVPNRNAILLSHAVNVAVTAGADTVMYGANKEDEILFADCRMAFVQAFNILLLNSQINVEVCAPYIDKPKWAIMDLARQLGVELHMTWSCYEGGKEPCGKCLACQKREEALSHDVAIRPV